MKIQIGDQVIQILDYLGQKFGIVVDWTGTNVMPYLEKLCGKIINYETWTSVVWLILGIIILLLCFILIYIMIKNDYDLYADGVGIPVPVVVIFLFITGTIMIICQIINIVTCYTLPEKIIFDYITTQLHG